MHEAAIAQGIVEQALAVVQREGEAGRITEITVEIGALQRVVPEALELAFRACAAGTVAEAAILCLHERSAWARCRLCGKEFAPDLEELSFACPDCDAADVLMIRGRDIILSSVVCETGEGPDPCPESM